MKKINQFYPHLLVVFGFILISLFFFYPVLQGKKIFQSDIVQYTGMAKEQNDFRDTYEAEPYWTNSAFGGMPTYQLGANYPHNYIKMLDKALRFLPRPADYLFLYFLGFYALLSVLKVDPLKAFFGALAFGFSTYLIIILGVGHNAKAHAIAYMPLVLAGCILVFNKRYVVGAIVSTFAVALEINANHFQMTYYLLILTLVVGCFYAIQFLKEKQYKSLLLCVGVLLGSALLAVGANATSLLATAEYAKESTRSKSELLLGENGKPKTSNNAMSYEYITEYSYGVAESFNLVAPRLFGGSNSEKLTADSKMNEFLSIQGVPPNQAAEILSSLPTYWGDQPIVAAPAYIGAIVFFLAVFAFFNDKRKIKYVFIIGSIISLLLSWGKNFPMLTDFFIDVVPMYNKFRAVSSIQVLLELCMPVLAVMGLQSFFTSDKELQWKNGWKSTAVVGGFFVFLWVIKSVFSFSGGNDMYYIQSYGYDFVNALKEDRKSMYTSDILRSLILVLIVVAIMWLSIKEKLNQTTTVILVGVLLVGDLFFVAKNYVDSTKFVDAFLVDQPFQSETCDQVILKDTTAYRVFEIDGAMSNARTSYFHHSIGGYHAAKPRRIQQLFDYQISKNNIEVLNFLNVKYVIQTDDQGKKIPGVNPEANGNAWFVSDVQIVSTPDEEMQAIKNLDSKKTAVINHNEFLDFRHKQPYVKDSTASIQLTSYKPNRLIYVSENKNKGLAVFSEIYYAKGWNAYLDNVLQPHIRADYTLRALEIPAGKHIVEFRFEPKVVEIGSKIALASSILIVLLSLGSLFMCFKKNKSL